MKNFYPKITILVSNFNGRVYLDRSIPCILKQDYSNFDIVVIDNNSSDDSEVLLRSYPNVKMIHNKKTGSKNSGLNLGLKYVTGDYVMFLDNDVLLQDADLLSSVVNEYLNTSSIGLMTCTLLNEGESSVYFYGSFLSRISFIKRNKRLPLHLINGKHGMPVVGVQGACFFTKKTIFEEIGYFDDSIPFGGEDVDIGIRSMMHGYRNYLFSKKILIHIGMNERIDNNKYVFKLMYSNAALYATIIKNYNFTNMIWSLALFIPYTFLRSVKDAVTRRDIRIFCIFFTSLKWILVNRVNLYSVRLKTQTNRKISRDTFLQVKFK